MKWPTWYEAIYNLHNPTKVRDVDKNYNYYQRLAFDEIFSNLLIFSEIKKRIKLLVKNSKKINFQILSKINKNIPFELTNSQKKVCTEILTDMNSEKKC